ncbi:hypothetical protein QTO34_005212 [Cnephaeus nilssonii]|uniref:G-protein coupled receptors family 1 profile domain-containing protein n=1 Tax=Cnephaeus nilssonii TaxID=3371016 RepID=A0AA40HNY3_CNENI|nr:hypothetical protein QTO34_005212 [Eptesicus nilssonii]
MGNSLEQKVCELTNDEPSRQKSSMRPENQSSVSQAAVLFFTLFLGMYLTTVLGNLLIILLIRLDSRLHTPMYVAICHPLHYSTIMSQALCTLLVAGSWMVVCVHALIHTLLLVRLSFCADNTITHFFCDLTVLLKLSCSDISLNNLVIFTEGGMLYFLPLSIVLGSYIRIGTIILRVPSTKRLSKAFSTCGSHLSVVSLYYGTLAGVYFLSSSWGSKDIIASVMYTVVTPMLNPFIYSLRSRDIKHALEMSPEENLRRWATVWSRRCVNSPMTSPEERRRSMRPENQSSVSQFLLLGLPIPPGQQGVFFTLFLGMYLTTVLGNLLIILLIRLDSRLHTPMYFFLGHLAFSDVCFSSVTVPKMLMNMQTQDQSIPYAGCVTQMYFFIFFGCIDNILLGVMAYDRYVAICHPLQYTTIMGKKLCTSLVAVSWLFSCSSAMSHTLSLVRLSFCADNTIPHFFCDLAALLKLSCSDISINELVIFTVGALGIIIPLTGILASYVRIGVSILRVPSTKGICKALSTCGSHLSVVFLFYGTIMILYIFPSSNNSNDKDIIASVMYTVVTPMLNPFIYSLRNRDMKGALGKLFRRRSFSPSDNHLIFSVLSSPKVTVRDSSLENYAGDYPCY